MIPKNKYLMTKNERIVYEKLKNHLSSKYEIFPQITVRSLIARNFTICDETKWKIVDFIICQRPYYEPILAIEVNDKTHERKDRQQRDKDVTEFLKDMNIPIWFLKPEQEYKWPDGINLDEHIEIMTDKYLEHKKIGFNINSPTL